MKSFKLQARLQSRIRINKFLYNISIIPFIKGILPDDPYRADKSYLLLSVIFFFSKFGSVVFYNFINSLVYFLSFTIVRDSSNGLGTWIVALSFTMALIRGFYKPTFMVNNTYINKTLQRDIQMPSKDIAKNNTIIYFINVVLNRLIIFVISPSILISIASILIWYGVSLFTDGIHKTYYKKHNEFFPKEKFIPQTIVTLIVVASGLPIFYLMFNERVVDLSTTLIFISSLIIFALGFYYNEKSSKDFDYYSYIRNSIKREEDTIAKFGLDVNESLKSKNERKIDHGIKEYSGKRFAYLNNIFFDRYKKVYSFRFTIINSILLVLIILAFVILFVIDSPSVSFLISSANVNILNHISLIFLLLYFLNIGEVITKALFFNCDFAMLRYRLYNKGSNVLPNFFERLKRIILINLPQGILMSILVIVVAIGLKLINNNLEIAMLFISINVMNMFFCIHSLVLYYVLQPYDKQMNLVNKTYSIVNSITYVTVYMLSDVAIELSLLTIGVLIFSSVYFVIASLLMYFVAPKTFRIK